jgi:class 3 adenylate cyclase
MQRIEEYVPRVTSPYELMMHLYDQILAGRITTLAALKDYTSVLPEGTLTAAIFKRAFELMRKLSWGYFRALGPEEFPELWKVMVVPDRQYPFAGDLKTTITSPDLFVGVLDLHGYTKFCQMNRHNMSRLDALDAVLFHDFSRLASKLGVISRRFNGDEIVLVGAHVEQVVETIMDIMGHLSRAFRKAVGAQQVGHNTRLPEFQISAGITGGQKYASVVVTRSGDLSGDLLNSAARLQARANKLSPDTDRILLSGHAYHRLLTRLKTGIVQLPYQVGYLNAGTVEFKGINLPVFEMLFLDREGYRLTYQPHLEKLFLSLRKKLWRGNVLEDALALAEALVGSWPHLGASHKVKILHALRAVRELFGTDQFEQALTQYEAILKILSAIKHADPLVVDYLCQIGTGYRSIYDRFQILVDLELEAQSDQTRKTLAKYHALYETTRSQAREQFHHSRSLWLKATEEARQGIEVRIRQAK